MFVKEKNRGEIGEYLHPLPSKAQASITKTILPVDPKEMVLCKQVSRERKG
jgi:hypothetical protein